MLITLPQKKDRRDLMTIIYFLACLGMTEILVYGSIFKKLREVKFLKKLLKCPLCTGFHCSWIIYLMFYASGIILFPNIYCGLFIYSCASAAVSYIGSVLFGDCGLNLRRTQ